MTRKHEMVSELTKRIAKARLALDGTTRYLTPDGQWEEHPQGHFRDAAVPSVESKLSCLTDEALGAILKDDLISVSRSWDELWNKWGNHGFLKSNPEILHIDDIPILRIRHDSYLRCLSDSGFLNCFDAYGNGNNGGSAMDLSQTRKAIMVTPSSDLFWSEKREEWYQKHKLFRKAMMLRYPYEACSCLNSFSRVLRNTPEIFDEFFNEVDAKQLHCDLDTGLDNFAIYDAMLHQTDDALPTFSATVVTKHRDSRSIIGTLLFSKCGVTLRQSFKGVVRQWCVNIPKWDMQCYLREAESNGSDTDYLSERDYYYQCWMNLALTILTTADIGYADESITPRFTRDLDSVSLELFPNIVAVSGIKTLSAIVRIESMKLRGTDMLCSIARA